MDRLPIPTGGLGLVDALHPALIGPFREETLGPCVTSSFSILTIDFGAANVTLRHGLDPACVPNTTCVLDSDYWTADRLGRDALASRLGLLHDFSCRFFRRCIAQELHKAFDPHEL